MQKIYFFNFLLFTATNLMAQTPDSLLKPSPVKTLTARQYDALMKGEDLYNMSLAADVNGFPSAQKALKHKKELDLSPAQTAALGKINTELQRKKIEMGGIIIKNERVIDSLFRTRKLNDGTIIFYTNRYGIYQGELRNAILQAAYKTYSLLTTAQVNKLKQYKNDN